MWTIASSLLSLSRMVFSPAAETGNSAFRSPHELKKVRHPIVSEQYLLSKAQYVVKWKSGIRSEINGCFSTSLPLERENEATKYRTFPFTVVAPKSTDMRQIPYHLKTCVTEVYSIVQKQCKRISTKFLGFCGFSKKFCFKPIFRRNFPAFS